MDTKNVKETAGATPSNFIRAIIEDDLKKGRRTTIVTRFPPEPNGYPHIGHAKSICLNFGLADDYNGVYHLRFDDTNPETEDIEYVNAIKRDIRWLGFDWADKEFYASDYFEQLYDWAVVLVKKGKAYVDDLSEEEIREYRGSVTEPGRKAIYVVGRDGGTPRKIHEFACDQLYSGLSVSPDFEWVAFIAPAPDGYFQVFRVPVTGGEAEQLTFDPTDKTHPSYAPDGQRIAFAVFSYQAHFWVLGD